MTARGERFGVLVVLVVLSGAAAGVGPGPGAATNATNGSAADATPTERPGGARFEISRLRDVVVPIGGPESLSRWNGTVRVGIRNVGDRAGSTWVAMFITGPPEEAVGIPTDQRRVQLEPGEETTVSLQPLGVVSGGPDNYSIRVRTADGAAAADARVSVYFPEFTYFTIGNITGRGFGEGENGTFLVPVENAGRPPGAGPEYRPSQGVAEVAVAVNGIEVARERAWLEVNESRTVAVSVPLEDFAPGRNRVTVRTGSPGNRTTHDEVSFTITNTTGRTEGGDGPGFGPLIALVGVLAGLGAWLGRRESA